MHQLSQGLQFIDIVCQDGDCSYEKQRVILKTVFESRYWDLLDLLENSLSAITWGYLTLAECTDEQLNVMLPPRDPADLDPGPRLAWFDIMANDQYDAVILPCHAGVRECAFVMWDASRIHQFGLLPALESMPASPTYKLDLNDPAYLEMVESWKSRDAVSSDGGSGYWSRGDNSRLVYPPVFVSRLPRT